MAGLMFGLGLGSSGHNPRGP